MTNAISRFFRRRKTWAIPYALFMLIFVVVPLLLIVYFAFTNEEGAFTLANFQKFVQNPEALNTFLYSLGIAIKSLKQAKPWWYCSSCLCG